MARELSIYRPDLLPVIVSSQLLGQRFPSFIEIRTKTAVRSLQLWSLNRVTISNIQQYLLQENVSKSLLRSSLSPRLEPLLQGSTQAIIDDIKQLYITKYLIDDTLVDWLS